MTFPQTNEGQSRLHQLNDDSWMFGPPTSTRSSLFAWRNGGCLAQQKGHQVVLLWTFPASTDEIRLPAIRPTEKFICFRPATSTTNLLSLEGRAATLDRDLYTSLEITLAAVVLRRNAATAWTPMRWTCRNLSAVKVFYGWPGDIWSLTSWKNLDCKILHDFTSKINFVLTRCFKNGISTQQLQECIDIIPMYCSWCIEHRLYKNNSVGKKPNHFPP